MLDGLARCCLEAKQVTDGSSLPDVRVRRSSSGLCGDGSARAVMLMQCISEGGLTRTGRYQSAISATCACGLVADQEKCLYHS